MHKYVQILSVQVDFHMGTCHVISHDTNILENIEKCLWPVLQPSQPHAVLLAAVTTVPSAVNSLLRSACAMQQTLPL